ncbi:unnamed protein product [Cuscuta campestris]|uniref:Pentacotripeptide-repeat region of PRORP domain-containing protein n=1 Tax=Cuscuta campestris TaxID=132261 RepID=A0A484M5R1_9ASTE|nr:unnamed protein product [Cuscuta campestris]
MVHAHLTTNGFSSNVHLGTKLIIFYSKYGDMEVAQKVFDGMSQRNLVSWTALLSGYSQNVNSGEALRVFATMHRKGLKGNQFAYASALRACTSLLCLERGTQVQGRIQKSRFAGNLFVQSALLDFHSKCGKIEDARHVFNSMLERDLISWNSMIGGYSFQGLWDHAFFVFRLMLREGLSPDCFTFGSVLRNACGDHSVSRLMMVSSIHGKGVDHCVDIFLGLHRSHLGIDSVILCSMLNVCANSTLLNLGRQMHTLALKYQSGQDVALGNSLIDMYSKTGEIEDAKKTFDLMKEKNIISWTSMITGYGMHGHAEHAISLYKKMESQGIHPNDVTFLSLFSACSHSGLMSQGWECFHNMVGKYKLLPRLEHYTCIVDLLARDGWLEEAHSLICLGSIQSNASLWGSILGACSMYGNMHLGEVAAKNLFSLKPKESANYVALANTYALAGLWQRAAYARELMKNGRLLKSHGYSFTLSNSSKNIPLLSSG